MIQLSLSDMFAKLLSVLIVSLVMHLCVFVQETAATQPGWKVVSVCGLTFSVPNDLEDQKSKGVDSCIASYAGKEITISLDYGWYSRVSRQDEYKHYADRPINIDGRKGRISTYKYGSRWVARIFVAMSPNKNGPTEVAFNMHVTGSNRKVLTTARKIFSSIKATKSDKP